MTAQGGFGLNVKINTGYLTTIAALIEGEYPEQEAFVAESTTHDATSGYATWVKTGKKALNEFTMTLAWDVDESTHAAVLTNLTTAASVGFSIQDPGGDEIIAFDAHVTKVKRISDQEDVYKAEITVQPTGAPTIT